MSRELLFDLAMEQGQVLHGLGEFEDAREHWQIAEGLAEDPVSEGRAIRGEAASLVKLGDLPGAIDRAKEALSLHGPAARENPLHLREEAQTRGVLTRMMFRVIAQKERRGDMAEPEARQEAGLPLAGIRRASSVLAEISQEQGVADQYLLNVYPHLVTGEALYGSWKKALHLVRYTTLAIRWTESNQLPTAANISLPNRRNAQKRMAAYSAAAALVVSLSATERTRPYALGVALSRAGW